MLTFSQMVVRLLVAMVLGAMMGFERELVGKEAGIRTAMLVAGGSAIFTMVSIIMPYMAQVPITDLKNTLPDRVLSNIVVGIGFLGAGIIIKTNEHVRGLTTAALIWSVSSIGVLVGLGLIKFAIVAVVFMSGFLYTMRKVRVYEKIRGKNIHQDQ